MQSNEFAVRATGSVRFATGIDPVTGVRLNAGVGSWSALSDRNAKTDFAQIDANEILERVATMPIGRWSYKTENPLIQHIGPSAQDFHATFNLGGDDRYINTIDADGISMAAIQALYRRLREKETEIATQRHLIEALTARLERLEFLVMGK